MSYLPFKNKYNIKVIDIFLGIASFYLAFYLRFDGIIPSVYYASFKALVIIYCLLKSAGFYLLGVYKRVWKYAGATDLFLVVYALTVTVLGLVTASYFLRVPVPRSVFIFTWMLDIILSGGMRALPKLWQEKGKFLHNNSQNRNARRLLVVGAGDAGVLVVKELFRQENLSLFPVGFIDDDPDKQHLRIMGLPVLGTRDGLEKVIAENNIDEVLIAMPSASGKVMREIVEKCRQAYMPVRTLPRMYDIINGQISVDMIREVRLEDLLGREPVRLDLDGIEGFIKGKRVLVTGAGGSIGAELCRQICRYGPEEVVLLEHDENPVFEIEMELRERYPHIALRPVIADIKDNIRINQVFGLHNPQVVFHAAAHKHVPLMELNPGESFKNNVIGCQSCQRDGRNEKDRRNHYPGAQRCEQNQICGGPFW